MVLWRLMYREGLRSHMHIRLVKRKNIQLILRKNSKNEDTGFGCFTKIMTRRKTFWHSHIKNILTGILLQAIMVIRLQQSQQLDPTCRMTKFANTKIKIYCTPSKVTFTKNEKYFRNSQ